MTVESELLLEDNAILSQEAASHVLVETVVERELLVESSSELLVEESNTSEVLTEQIVVSELLSTEVPTTYLLEVAEQGPPGPTGEPGPQGLPGLAGEANLGGLEIYVQNPTPGDVLQLDPTNTWINAPQAQLVDGGNF